MADGKARVPAEIFRVDGPWLRNYNCQKTNIGLLDWRDTHPRDWHCCNKIEKLVTTKFDRSNFAVSPTLPYARLAHTSASPTRLVLDGQCDGMA